MELRNKTIVVTGPTGMVGPPLCKSLAADNRVIALARFSDPDARADLEAGGVECIVADLPILLDQASVPATTLNWASPGLVSIAEWCAYMAEIDGCDPPKIVEADTAIPSTVMDTSRIEALRPDRLVRWQDGIRRLVQNHPA